MGALYRYFDKIEYALDAASGNFTFTKTKTYRDYYKSTRKDEFEQIYTSLNNRLTTTREIGDDIYTLSFSRILSNSLKSKFGQFVIEICDLKALSLQLTNGLEISGIQTLNGIHSSNITYIKDDPNDLTDYESRIFTKRALYSEEQEYRFLFIPRNRIEQDRIVISTSLRPILLT